MCLHHDDLLVQDIMMCHAPPDVYHADDHHLMYMVHDVVRHHTDTDMDVPLQSALRRVYHAPPDVVHAPHHTDMDVPLQSALRSECVA